MDYLQEQHPANTSLHRDDPGDGVHGEVAWVKDGGRNHLEPVVDFDYGAVDAVEEPDEAKTLTWSDMTSIMIRLTDFCLKARTLQECGGKLCALRHWLDDGSSGFESYTSIAKNRRHQSGGVWLAYRLI